MDLELYEESKCRDDIEAFGDKLLKRRAINSIDDIISSVYSLREAHANVASSHGL